MSVDPIKRLQLLEGNCWLSQFYNLYFPQAPLEGPLHKKTLGTERDPWQRLYSTQTLSSGRQGVMHYDPKVCSCIHYSRRLKACTAFHKHEKWKPLQLLRQAIAKIKRGDLSELSMLDCSLLIQLISGKHLQYNNVSLLLLVMCLTQHMNCQSIECRLIIIAQIECW